MTLKHNGHLNGAPNGVSNGGARNGVSNGGAPNGVSKGGAPNGESKGVSNGSAVYHSEVSSTDYRKQKVNGLSQNNFKWFFGFLTLSTRVETNEEDWIYSEEPHSERRKEILSKHPEIKSLMGADPWIVVPVTISVISQIVLCWLIQDASWSTIFFMAYCIGGVFNHSLGSAIHEIGHNLAFGHGKYAWLNRVLSLWCNLPLGVPMAISYKKYHADHHRYLGEEMQDVDIPTRLEAFLFRHPLTKIVWLFFHPLIHSIRPFYKSPKPLTGWEIINTIVQATFNIIMFKVFGGKALVYMIAGTLLSLGLHPLAGHFISEHYLFTQGQATHSYYGPLNFILYNVGYHNEHHDFPYIPYTRLEKLRQTAPEYYDNLPYHTSWIRVVWDFIFDSSMGPHAHGIGYMKDSAKTKSS